MAWRRRHSHDHSLTLLQPLPGGKPWGLRNSDTNYYTDYPITGVTREYDWTITKQACAPDGVNVTCLMVNGQYPGPAIEANWVSSYRNGSRSGNTNTLSFREITFALSLRTTLPMKVLEFTGMVSFKKEVSLMMECLVYPSAPLLLVHLSSTTSPPSFTARLTGTVTTALNSQMA